MTSKENQRHKGIITLSLGRSGTSWLKSISNATERMGDTREWLSFKRLEKPLRTFNAQSYYDHIMQRCITPNGRFSLKVFPHHLRNVHARFSFDFIRQCAQDHDVKFYLVTREDRLGQAISMLKAQQSDAWADKGIPVSTQQKRKIRYNFRRLCRIYFELGQGYDFWRSYLGINKYDYEAFTYETLLPNPAPYFESTAKHLGVSPPESYESSLSIQRDSLTKSWRQRFHDDIENEGIHPEIYALQQPQASMSNALKVLTGRPILSSH